jgi:hypothetical protein
LLAGAPADDLDDDGEDRHAEDERGEVEVQLRDRPHRQARAEVREGPVRRLLARRLLGLDGQREEDQDDGGEQQTGRARAPAHSPARSHRFGP